MTICSPEPYWSIIGLGGNCIPRDMLDMAPLLGIVSLLWGSLLSL